MARLGLLVLALSGASSAQAQVNTERVRASVRDVGVYFQIDGSVDWMRGNVDYLDLSTSLSAGYNGKVHHPLLTFSAAYSEWQEAAYLSRAFAHMRWTANWHPHVASEIFAQAQYDAFLFLRVRAVSGGGARFTFLKRDEAEIHLGTGYMIEREVFQESQIPDDEPHPLTTTNHRWTNYLTFTIRIDEMLSVTNTIYVQPRFDDFSDYRLLEEAALNLKHTSGLTLSMGVSIRFDSDPPTVLSRLDTNLFARMGIQLHHKTE